jgi:hypothetical protein
VAVSERWQSNFPKQVLHFIVGPSVFIHADKFHTELLALDNTLFEAVNLRNNTCILPVRFLIVVFERESIKLAQQLQVKVVPHDEVPHLVHLGPFHFLAVLGNSKNEYL